MGRKVFVAAVAALFFYITFPFILPVAMGAIFAALFSPWLHKLEKKGISVSGASALLTFGIVFVLLLPATTLIFLGIKASFAQVQGFKNASQPIDITDALMRLPRVRSILTSITHSFPIQMDDLLSAIQDLSKSFGGKLAEWLGGFLSHIPGIAIGMVVIVVSIYFFLSEGQALVFYAKRNSVFSEEETNRLLKVLSTVCRSVILASLISGTAQALIEILFCIVTATPNIGIIGLLVFVSSFVPLIGSMPITLFVALQQFLSGRTSVGIVLFVAVFVVISVDNIIRPWFLKGSSNLHPMIAFIAALGGLQMLGFQGIFLGPIIAALFVELMEIHSVPIRRP